MEIADGLDPAAIETLLARLAGAPDRRTINAGPVHRRGPARYRRGDPHHRQPGVNTDWLKVFLDTILLIAVLLNSYIRKKVMGGR